MRIKNISMIVAIALLAGCNTKTVQVHPADNLNYNEVAIFYSLPRSVIYVNVKCERSVFIPGPYASFAKKYLGLDGVVSEPKTTYSINDIDFDIQVETDPSAIYAILPTKKGYGNYLKLNEHGLVLPIDANAFGKTIKSSKKESKENTIVFKDLSYKPFIEKKKATFYGRVLNDSVFTRVPIKKTMVVEKNIEEKAKEAAEFIFNLRERRLEFLTTDVDQPFSGDAINEILNEIQRLEDKYLSLFIGKTYTSYSTQTFSYVPTNSEGESTILFRFSEIKGILPQTDLSGRPILLEVEVPNTSLLDSAYKSLNTRIQKDELTRFYYRVPAYTNISVVDGSEVLAKRRVAIYQYGPIFSLPINYPER
jgi:hypothetical protein